MNKVSENDTHNPAIKLLLRYKKKTLTIQAKCLNLSAEGTKLDLAVRIAAENNNRFQQLWNIISKDVTAR